MDFEPDKKYRPEDFRTPDASEEECLRNTSPEVIKLLILGFLQSMTGQDWDVRVEAAGIENVGDFLYVKAQLNMGILKENIGKAPKPLIVPTEPVKV